MLWTIEGYDGMNDFRLLVLGSWCYVQLKVVDDMNDSWSWDQGPRYYEQLRAIDDMNNSGS